MALKLKLPTAHDGLHPRQRAQSRLHRAQLRVRSHSPVPTPPSLTEPHSDHIKELNNARPKQPFYFLKPPSSILLPRSGPVLRPRGVNLHYEVELAFVVG